MATLQQPTALVNARRDYVIHRLMRANRKLQEARRSTGSNRLDRIARWEAAIAHLKARAAEVGVVA
jgi:hypothetical protein